MSRTTVYIPAELKALMDKAQDNANGSINWSAIAQEAFEKEARRELSRDYLHLSKGKANATHR